MNSEPVTEKKVENGTGNTPAPDGTEKKSRRRPGRGAGIFYFISEAFKGMRHHSVMTAASVIVLTSCLVLLGAFLMLLRNINVNLEKLGLLNEIAVFTDGSLTPEEVGAVGESIKKLDNVDTVKYVSKDSGLESMKEQYPDCSDLFESIKNNGDNPLSDSFIITYRDNSGVYELESELHKIPGVVKVNNRLDYAVKVGNFKNGMSFVFAWFFVLLFTVSVFIIFNTIRLAVEGRRNEIDIMRYIGATNSFIITPFIIEGSLIGGVSGILAFFADMGLYRLAVSKLSAELDILEYLPFRSFAALLIIGFLAVGILSGVLTSLFSIRKNLKN